MYEVGHPCTLPPRDHRRMYSDTVTTEIQRGIDVGYMNLIHPITKELAEFRANDATALIVTRPSDAPYADIRAIGKQLPVSSFHRQSLHRRDSDVHRDGADNHAPADPAHPFPPNIAWRGGVHPRFEGCLSASACDVP